MMFETRARWVPALTLVFVFGCFESGSEDDGEVGMDESGTSTGDGDGDTTGDGDGDTTGDGDGDTTGDGDGDTTGDGDGDTTGDGDGDTGTDPCDECLANAYSMGGACYDEYSACQANVDCVELFDCADACDGNTTCTQACFDAAPPVAQQLYLPVVGCIIGNGMDDLGACGEVCL